MEFVQVRGVNTLTFTNKCHRIVNGQQWPEPWFYIPFQRWCFQQRSTYYHHVGAVVQTVNDAEGTMLPIESQNNIPFGIWSFSTPTQPRSSLTGPMNCKMTTVQGKLSFPGNSTGPEATNRCCICPELNDFIQGQSAIISTPMPAIPG